MGETNRIYSESLHDHTDVGSVKPDSDSSSPGQKRQRVLSITRAGLPKGVFLLESFFLFLDCFTLEVKFRAGSCVYQWVLVLLTV